MIFLEATVRSGAGGHSVEAEGLRLNAPDTPALAAYVGRRVVLGMRPEHLTLGEGVPGLGFDARGDQVRLSAQSGRLHFFDPETEFADLRGRADRRPAAIPCCSRNDRISIKGTSEGNY